MTFMLAVRELHAALKAPKLKKKVLTMHSKDFLTMHSMGCRFKHLSSHDCQSKFRSPHGL